MKVALVHDWLTGMRGGEKCLEVLCELWPEADVFTLLHVPGSVSAAIERHRIVTSRLQGWPAAARGYRWYLPAFPALVESFDLSGYELVVSSSHCVAKGALAPPDALHVSYVHSPMRYAWDLWPAYFPPRGWVNRWIVPPVLTRLRSWDASSAARVDRFACNSRFVQRRIRRCYGRTATVVPPPVDTGFFELAAGEGSGYLLVSALVPSKGIELAIEAFHRLDLPLKIVGTGPARRKLSAMAGRNIELVGWLPDEELRAAYAACAAVVHPAVEDFGIVPLEAASSGRPAIALGRAGSLETVVPLEEERAPDAPEPTGILYSEPTVEALVAAVRRFEEQRALFRPAALRAHALGFDRARYAERMRAFVDEALADWRASC